MLIPCNRNSRYTFSFPYIKNGLFSSEPQIEKGELRMPSVSLLSADWRFQMLHSRTGTPSLSLRVFLIWPISAQSSPGCMRLSLGLCDPLSRGLERPSSHPRQSQSSSDWAQLKRITPTHNDLMAWAQVLPPLTKSSSAKCPWNRGADILQRVMRLAHARAAFIETGYASSKHTVCSRIERQSKCWQKLTMSVA